MSGDSRERQRVNANFSAERLQAAREYFPRHGISIGDWADREGYNRQLVYHVVAGRKACAYGKTHDIAVKIGLKADPNLPLDMEAAHG
jgi:gp16 family phage-associated protein